MKDRSSNGKYHWITQVKTNGGKTSTLWSSINGAYQYTQTGAKKYHYLAKRSAKVSLKKGQTVYLYMNFSSGSENAKATLKIS